MGPRVVLCIFLVVGVLFVTISSFNVAAQSCRKLAASSEYPQQAASNETIQVTTTITGSCTSGPEDFFSVRVDITDSASEAPLSSESASIGYSVANFSAKVQNSVLTPADNRTWLIKIDSYLFINGEESHLNSTTGMIQVGGAPVPEFQVDPSLVLLLGLTAALSVYRRPHPHTQKNT